MTAHILYGTEPSFYTRKAWAALRLLGLEVDDRLKSLAVKEEVEAAAGGYRRFPVVQTPEGDWLTDSTDIALTLSCRHPARSLIPKEPALAFLVRLAEEWADEWLLRAALVHRGLDPETRAWAAARAAMNLLGLPGDAPLPERLAPMHTRLTAGVEGFFGQATAVNGVTEASREAVMLLFDRTLAALETALADGAFLAGTRPSLADAALWGFLEAGLLWEPAPAALVRARAPHLAAFHARLGALAGQGGSERGEGAGSWAPFDAAAARLAPLLADDALGFAPFLEANRSARAEGRATLLLDGVEVPARGFTEKGRHALGRILATLEPDARARVLALGWPILDVLQA